MTLRELADRYIALREDAGYKTQRSFAAAIGINYKTIDSHENGRRPMSHETLVKYADFFGVSTDYLLGRTDVKSSNTEIKDICKKLDLSEEAISTICNLGKTTERSNNLNWGLEMGLAIKIF